MYDVTLTNIINIYLKHEARRGTETEAWDYKRDKLWVRFPLMKTKHLIFSFPRLGNAQSEPGAFSPTTPEFGGKCETEVS